jgi:IclR family acetate operon transcriptional repressor
MVAKGGVAGLSDLTAICGLPLPTVHRMLRTLVNLGYVRREPYHEYALGARLIQLGESATQLITRWAKPELETIVDALGETTNLALLDDDRVVFVAQAPGRQSMRMFTEVGRRAGLHCTAVGKAILAALHPEEARKLLNRAGLPGYTTRTIVDLDSMMVELERVRELGYALDEGEQDDGVRCLAVVVPSQPVRAAVSITGPAIRLTDELVDLALPHLRLGAQHIADALADRS